MLNFNTNIETVIATQETTKKAREFVEYASKKKLLDAGVLNETQRNYISQLKGTFSFSLHISNRYLVVTMYYSREKKYGYLVVDLTTFGCAEANSVKEAKKGVIELLDIENKVNENAEATEPKKTSKKKSETK